MRKIKRRICIFTFIAMIFVQVSSFAEENKELDMGVVAMANNDSTMVSDEVITSDLWGQNGEKYDPRGRLLDYSYVGYERGEKTLPHYKVVVNVKDFGAKGDGVTDDTAAIKAAIAAAPSSPDGASVYLPPGTYMVTESIFVDKNYVSLRGAGPELTTILCHDPENPVIGEEVVVGVNTKYPWNTTYDFRTNMIGGAVRGDTSINVESTDNLTAGQIIDISYKITDPNRIELYWAYLFDNQEAVYKPQSQLRFSHVARITKVDVVNKTIHFDAPLRQDIWADIEEKVVDINKIAKIHHSGVEDLTIQGPPTAFPGGGNPDAASYISLKGEHNWARNIVTIDTSKVVDVSYAKHMTATDIVAKKYKRLSTSEQAFEGFGQGAGYLPLRRTNIIGHTGVGPGNGAYGHLFKNIRLEAGYAHSVSIGFQTDYNVFSNITSSDGIMLRLDHHHMIPRNSLFTQIYDGLDEGNDMWFSGGTSSNGPNAARGMTYWNLDSVADIGLKVLGKNSWAPISATQFVGIRNSSTEEIIEPNGTWFEVNKPKELYPQNIYEAQLSKRFADQQINMVPPVAEVSTDIVRGTAPLTVNFDGSDSIDSDGTIESYHWFFGENTASTDTVDTSYKYTVPGVYFATLTVTDNDGNQNLKGVKIIVEGEDIPISPVINSIQQSKTENHLSWNKLNDRSIKYNVYRDGVKVATTSDNVYIDTEFPSNQTVRYTVKAVTLAETESKASNEIVINTSDSNIGETGRIFITQNSRDEWVKVNLKNTYSKPVVAASLSFLSNDKNYDPALVRIRNVTSDSFEVQVGEWEYQDGVHEGILVSYLVMESGNYTLPGGLKVEVGTVDAKLEIGDMFTGKGYKKPFKQDPLLLLQAQTSNSTPIGVLTIDDDRIGFIAALKEEDAADQHHVTETVGYIAIEASNGNSDGILYDAARLAKVNHINNPYVYTLNQTFSDPLVIASLQPYESSWGSGDDRSIGTGLENMDIGTRIGSDNSVELFITEERSTDDEVVSGTYQDAGVIVFDGERILTREEASIRADITADVVKGIAPLTVNFSAADRGNQFSWNFGDGQTSSEQNVSHTFNKPGTYLVKLSVNNGADMVSKKVVVEESSLSKDLVAWYSFEKGAFKDGYLLDDSGNEHRGGVYNGMLDTNFVDGKFGKGLYFDGEDDQISIPTLRWKPDEFTVSFWLKPASLESGTQKILTELYNKYNFKFQINATSGISIGMKSYLIKLPKGTLTQDQWHMITFTYENQIGTLYVDGVEKGSMPMLAQEEWGGFSLGSQDGNTLHCVLDDFRVYKRGLNSNEIISLMASNTSPQISMAATANPAEIILGQSTSVSVTATDTDNDPLTYNWRKVSGPGTVTFSAKDANATAVFSDAGTYNIEVSISDGKASAVSTCEVTVLEPNQAPLVADDNFTVREGELLNVNTADGLLKNDSDPEGESMMVKLVSDVSHGVLEINNDGSFTYTSNSSGETIDSFTYKVSDEHGAYSSVATVTINIETVPATESQLFLHWKLDGNTIDSSGNNRIGTLSGTESWVAGYSNQGLETNGIDNRMQYDIPKTTLNQFTVSLWARSGADGQPDNTGVFNNNSNGSDFQIDMDGKNNFRYNGNGATKTKFGVAPLNQWVHLAVVCDGVDTHLYYNGTKVATLDGITNTDFGKIDLGVNRGNFKFFKGTLDELRVFDKALTDTQVTELFNLIPSN